MATAKKTKVKVWKHKETHRYVAKVLNSGYIETVINVADALFWDMKQQYRAGNLRQFNARNEQTLLDAGYELIEKEVTLWT